MSVLDEIFERVKERRRGERENLIEEIRKKMCQLRSQMESVKCEGCEVLIRQAYDQYKFRCEALCGRVDLSLGEWESVKNTVPIDSFKCHECIEYDWSRRGNIGPFTPYEFYRFCAIVLFLMVRLFGVMRF